MVILRRIIEQSWIKPNIVTVVLWPLSLMYRLLFGLRSMLYASGVISSYKAPVPVLVVGNLTVGGTGKTPLVIHLVETLRGFGFNPGVISRGYGGSASAYPYVVTTDSPVDECGDEPALIVSRTAVPMVVGPDRRASIEALLELTAIDIVISDDGLQHLALQRDLEICLMDSTSPLVNNFLLPAGPYREALSRLKTVDLIVDHGVDNDSDLRFAMNLSPSAPRPVSPEAGFSQQFPAEFSFHAVAGIGNPSRFFNTCRKLGYTFSEHRFPDHHPFSKDDIDFAGETVLMTEKDAVKCQNFAQSEHWYLPVDATLSAKFDGALKARLTKLN